MKKYITMDENIWEKIQLIKFMHKLRSGNEVLHVLEPEMDRIINLQITSLPKEEPEPSLKENEPADENDVQPDSQI